MRRAVRDYKYEVNESRMTEECIQYLTQLQKDWERHRVKMGVEALRKEVRCTAMLASASVESAVRSQNGNGNETSTRTLLLTSLQARELPAYQQRIPPQCSTMSTSCSTETSISHRGSPLRHHKYLENSSIHVICCHYSSHLILAYCLPHRSNDIL